MEAEPLNEPTPTPVPIYGCSNPMPPAGQCAILYADCNF